MCSCCGRGSGRDEDNDNVWERLFFLSQQPQRVLLLIILPSTLTFSNSEKEDKELHTMTFYFEVYIGSLWSIIAKQT